MSEFFIGQIMMAGFNFAPKYFAQCNGQLLPINQNQALFSLLGTQYGGNGTTNFALPDLRRRIGNSKPPFSAVYASSSCRQASRTHVALPSGAGFWGSVTLAGRSGLARRLPVDGI